MAHQYIGEASVPVALHLDECADLNIIMQCIKAGFLQSCLMDQQ